MNVKKIPSYIFYEKINNILKNFLNKLPYQNSILLHAIKYSMLSGGKRLRPFLVYCIGKMFEVSTLTLDKLAIAIECIHTYSLIHDDLPAMDNNNLRRGNPTCHIKYGEDIAILAGDALQTLAFSILCEEPMININSKTRIKMISELSLSSGFLGMCYGQSLDLSKSDKTISLKNLDTINHYKTSVLIRSAIRLSTLASNIKNDEILKILDNYANTIGLAFQIQDDILDITDDSLIIRKSQKRDILLQKNTYPKLIGLHNSKIKCKELFIKAMKYLDELKSKSLNTDKLKELTIFIFKRNK